MSANPIFFKEVIMFSASCCTISKTSVQLSVNKPLHLSNSRSVISEFDKRIAQNHLYIYLTLNDYLRDTGRGLQGF